MAALPGKTKPPGLLALISPVVALALMLCGAETRCRAAGGVETAPSAQSMAGKKLPRSGLDTAKTSTGAASDYDPNKVIQESTRAIERNPKDANPYYWRGDALSRLGQYESAIKDFTQAIKLSPAMAAAYAGRGIAYTELRQLKAALADLNKAISLNPRLPQAYTARGNVYYQMEKYGQALADFNQGIKLNPKDATAYVNRTQALYAMGQYQAMIADCTRVIKMNPKDATAYDNRGLAYDQLKQHKLAIQDYNTALKLKPNEAKFICHRGISYCLQGEYDEAIRDLTEAIRLKPNYALAYFNRGVAHYLRQEYEQANKDVQAAIHHDSRYALAWTIMPLEYGKKGEKGIPDSEADKYYHRAVSRILLIKNETALTDLRKYLDLKGWQAEHSQSAAILMYLGYRLGKNPQAAKAVLDEAAGKCDTMQWPYPVIRYFRGEIGFDELLKIADEHHELTDVHAYVGIHRLWNGEKAQALSHLKWVKDEGMAERVSHSLAMREHEKLHARKTLDTERN